MKIMEDRPPCVYHAGIRLDDWRQRAAILKPANPASLHTTASSSISGRHYEAGSTILPSLGLLPLLLFVELFTGLVGGFITPRLKKPTDRSSC
jgi:hypothetical protein